MKAINKKLVNKINYKREFSKNLETENTTYYIVGNKIKEQLKIPNIMTYDELIKLFTKNSTKKIEFRLGQGLSKQQINSIAYISKLFLNCNYKFSDSCKAGIQFSNQLVHKSNSKNTMISIPEIIAEKKYKSFLLIDEECAEMSDHTTGFHIQGMVLIEAARQMVNAVAEKYLIKNKRYNYFVLKNIDAKFNQYIFPIEIEVVQSILDIKYKFDGSYSATSKIDFIQNNTIGMSILIQHQALDTFVMKNYELGLMNKCLKNSI